MLLARTLRFAIRTVAVAAVITATAAMLTARAPEGLGVGLSAGVGVAIAGAPSQSSFGFEAPTERGEHWYRGNTHTHTLGSDGDSPPETVARWYKEHGYQFLVLSDHNVLTDPAALAHLVDEDFLLIAGEEVSSSFEGRPVHVNGINIRERVEPQRGGSLVDTIQRNVDAIREVEGSPHVNHPNFRWAIGAAELAQVENDRLLEIYNGHPHVHNVGGGGTPGLEAVWDQLLSGGKRIYGIAVDDAHHFQEFGPEMANPGRGWVAVRADSLTPAAIVAALEAGHFYASTGVVLDDVVIESRRLTVHIATRDDFRYTTTFIGAGGRVLAVTGDNPAVFELAAPEPYVRARVVDSRGERAWVQPVFVRGADG